jgi:hypothetical protein
MSSDGSRLTTIDALVGEERDLRAQLAAEFGGDGGAHREPLKRLEAELDQCWDLLNQRRALRAVDASPDEARLRPASQAKGYRG